MERLRPISIRPGANAGAAASPSTSHVSASPRLPRLNGEPARRSALPRTVDRIDLVFRVAWGLLVLPFRLIGWTFDFLGRLIGFVFGFTLMVCGSALWAGPLYLLGVPMFLIGLLLTLKSVG